MLAIRPKAGVVLIVVVCVAGGLTARQWRRGALAREATRIMSTLRARPSWPSRFDLGRELRAESSAPALPASTVSHLARVTLPERSTEPLRVEDVTTGMTIDVQVRGAFNVVGQGADGYLVYPHAHSSGGTLLHRVVDDGAEDFISFETRPAVPEVAYDLTLAKQVSGLRLIEGTLEMLDDDGAPRLRATPPFIVGADGVRTDATLAVEGCAVDTNPAGPWGRDLTPPGADTCILRVRWPDEQVQYPAVLDPQWQTTGNMSVARQDHVAILLSTGTVLVAGGRSTTTSTTGLASAELFDRTTNTWSPTGSMTTGGRYQFTATQLGTNSNSNTSAHVLVAGGSNAGASLSTAQLYSVSAGTWAPVATNLPAVRSSHTATLLASGKVLLAAGVSGSTVLNTAVLYDPSTGTGTWTPTGSMPQPVKGHTATLLAATSNTTLKNKVIVVGGNSGTASVGNVQLFDGTSAWSSLTALSSAREGQTATALVNGNVLITGGKSGTTILNTTQLFNAASGSGSWASAGTMTAARQLHTATLLPAGTVANGQVLLTGGNNSSGTLGTTELWNGTSNWTSTTALSSGVQGQAATLLSNNMVLIAGGTGSSGTVATAVLYDASFALACTANSQCTTGFCVSGVCCDSACDGGCGVCNLAGKVGTCSAAASSTVCRAQSGACDVAETCNGTSLTCPTDAVAVLGTVCRNATSVCDVPETCDGATKACPADGFAPATTVCRASTGTCDAAETCTGTSATCPADAFASATTICRPAAGGCDVAETCTGTSSICPPDGLAAAGTVCRAAESLCDVAETCSGSTSACPTDSFAAAGTTCGAASSGGTAPVCSGSAGTCPVASGTSDVLGFESIADWAFDPAATGTIVGPNPSRTQGQSSLEVTAQNWARLNSVPMSSIGSVGSLVLLDVQLPTSQANPSWYGDAQMFVNSPSLGINNVPLGDVGLTGLALTTWQTLAFQIPAATAATIAHGVYSDLTFSVVLNVPSNETGHYLLDNIRSIPDVVPSLLGIAQDGATLKAVFDYQTTSSTPVNITYGTANGLTNQSGFITLPQEVPPTTFLQTTHAPFVATLSGSFLTWTVGSHSVTATPSSHQLPVTTNGDGTHDATLAGGGQINLDSLPPASPTKVDGPPVGAPFNGALAGKFAVSASGAATYTVPISIPPGIAGMAPNLSLVYSSQGSPAGIAGNGWNLTGLSEISRCPRTRQQDGFGRPVMLDSLTPSENRDRESDGLCLDGAKLFKEDPGVGNCPASSPTPCYEGEKQDFSLITLNPTGEFQVVTKAGETRYYGLNTTERVIGGPTDQTAIWLLDRVVDSWGNYFDVHYNMDTGPNIVSQNAFMSSGIWASEIRYTGSLATPQTTPFNSISFGYLPANRGAVHWTTLGPLRIPQVKILQTITSQSITTQSILGQYSLTYQGGTGFGTQLQTIGYCAGGTCMQPLTFDWQSPSLQSWPANPNYRLPSDIFGTGEGLKGTQFVDINGDGLVDFVLARMSGEQGANSPQIVTLLNTGTGWSAPLAGQNETFPVFLADKSFNPADVVFADMDGDGAVDVLADDANVVCGAAGCISCPIGVDPGSPGCINPTNYSPAVWLNRFKQGGGWEFHPEYSNMPPDPNGANSISEPDPSLRGNGFGVVFPGAQFGSDQAVTVADINGDGLADFVRVFDTTVGQTRVDWLLAKPPCVASSPGTPTTKNCEGPPWVPTPLPGHVVYPTSHAGASFQLQDINRDGLPDLVSASYSANSDGSAFATQDVLINQTTASGPVTFGGEIPINMGTGAVTVGANLNAPAQFGDIDGDGFYDLVAYYNAAGLYGNTSPAAIIGAVGLGNGSSFGFESEFTTSPFAQFLKTFSPPEGSDNSGVFTLTGLVPFDYGYAILDINGDGLADFIQNHQGRTVGSAPNQGGGQIFLSTGTSWVPLDGNQIAWEISAGQSSIPGVIPSSATQDFGSAFLDLNGDGLPDLIQTNDNSTNLANVGDGLQVIPANAWINPLQPPIITGFPNGLAQPTIVTYEVTTSAAGASTYVDDDTTAANTKPLAVPLKVVSSVLLEDASGTGALDTMTYTYHSMRQDSFGRGPLGFHRVAVFDQASGTKTETTYAQAYPYTGLPTEVDKSQFIAAGLGSGFHATTQTTTTYCDTLVEPAPAGLGCGPPAAGAIAPGTKVFVFPSQVVDIAYLHPESGGDRVDQIATTSNFAYDNSGNATFTLTSVTKSEGGATESFSKSVQNIYSTVDEQAEGIPSETIVLGSGGTKATTHTTTFDYLPASFFGGIGSRLVLSKKHVEPDADWPIRLDSAYAYDQFGNLATTTDCASDFGQCAPGATNPSTQGDPFHHPPFRTTTVSYDPSLLGLPVSYGPGRFPVRTTNAAGQAQTTVYDPNLGQVLNSTDPNNIETCFAYDALGRMSFTTDRCNSSDPLVTSTQYASAPPPFCVFPPCATEVGFSLPNSRTVTVITDPAGVTSWTYGDDQGKSVGTLSYAFDGGLNETTMAYNAVGQVRQAAKPFHKATVNDPGTPSYTTTQYDSFNRVLAVTDPLGVIDASGSPKSTVISMTYDGPSIETDRMVNGQTETRIETKNAIGKVAATTTTQTNLGNVTMSYSYDADGDLTLTTDPAGNHFQVGYDTRGRRTSSSDPDMGGWSYTEDGFGDLVQQIDPNALALNNTSGTTMTYDPLGRRLSRTDSSGTAHWVYDTAHGAGIGKLAVMVSASDPGLKGTCAIPQGVPGTGGQVAVKSFIYTAFGEVQEVDECADGATFTTSYQYDALGRQSQIRYPMVGTSQLAVGYHFTALGYLQYLTDDSVDDSILWQAKAMNALGQVTDEQMRNGVETSATRNSLTGWLLNSVATAHSNQDRIIQNWTYSYDEVGNLQTRIQKDAVNAVVSSETFGYDLTNRLTSSLTTAPSGYSLNEPYAYDPNGLGNLTNKGLNSYNYGTGCRAGTRSAGPHAVCTVAGGPQFTYDNDGNLTSDGSRSVTYNPMNKVIGITSASGSVQFIYGGDGNRVVQSATTGGVTSRTVYVGLGATGKSLFEQTTTGSSVQSAQFIYAGNVHGGNAFALRVIDQNGVTNQYYSFDHLGSVTAMSDDQGRVSSTGPDATVLGYDAWGARRNPDGTAAASTAFDLPPGHREFAGQEEIPAVGLVNMNGRLYDPSIGRFLSPDPSVQFASDLQSYNRYSYVGNNPLRYSDPTGYFWSQIGGFFEGLGAGLSNQVNDFFIVAGIGMCVLAPGVGCIAAGLILAMAQYGIAVDSGESEGTALLNAGIGLGVGVATFGVGAEFGTMAGIVSGAASAAVMTGVSNVESDKGFFGTDMLDAAIISAGQGAAMYGLQHSITVTEASQAAEYQAQVAAEAMLNQVAGAAAVQSQAQTSAMMASAIGTASGIAANDAANAVFAASPGGPPIAGWGAASAGATGGIGAAALGEAAARVLAFASRLLGVLSLIAVQPEATTNDGPQYVVRAGIATPMSLQTGSSGHYAVPGITGFSVQSYPGLSIQELAAAGAWPNLKISVTTVQQLSDIGVQVLPTPGDGFHATVVVPVPLPIDLAVQISSVFTVQPNPVVVPR
jgi:RHS repeat-associated protein